jgi:hypothetical protein
MNRYVRTLAIISAASSLVFTGVANGQRPTAEDDTAAVTWKDAPGTILRESSASAGTKVVKDAETGRLRPARAGELPETAIGRPTEIIESPDGSGVAIVGDDLMSESVATKLPDGSIRVGHDAGARTHAEVK